MLVVPAVLVVPVVKDRTQPVLLIVALISASAAVMVVTAPLEAMEARAGKVEMVDKADWVVMVEREGPVETSSLVTPPAF